MYFTSSAKYALPYYANQTDPAILVCLVIPGANSDLGLPSSFLTP